VLAFATGRGKRLVQMQQLRVSIGRSNTLSARIGKIRITVAHLRGTPRTAHDADAAAISGLRVELTPRAAKVLDRVLKVKVFKAGQRLGTIAIEAHLAQLVLTSGYTALTPDAGTVQALAAQGITVAPLKGTKLGTAGDLILPLVSGLVERDTLVGRIRHAGGIVFSKGGTEVPVANFNLDVTRQPLLSSLTAAGRLDLADVTLPQTAPAVSGDRLTVEGIGLALTASAAAALNETFSTTVFTAGMPLGTAVTRATIL
jgi:hypothetical protein